MHRVAKATPHMLTWGEAPRPATAQPVGRIEPSLLLPSGARTPSSRKEPVAGATPSWTGRKRREK